MNSKSILPDLIVDLDLALMHEHGNKYQNIFSGCLVDGYGRGGNFRRDV